MADRPDRSDRITLDDLLGDLFELNMQGLRSIRALFLTPATYFAAAEIQDWRGTYTPSIRLYLSLLAVLFFFQFIWASEEAPLVQVFAAQFEAQGIPLPDGLDSYTAMGIETTRWVFAFLPFTFLLSLMAFAAVYRLWGRATTLALRERLVFAIVVPSTALTIFTTLATTQMAPEHMGYYSLAAIAITIIADTTTAYRGAFPTRTVGGRLWRAILLGICIMIINFIANFTAQIGGGFVVGYLYG